jgi:hypothetical protein
VYNDGAIIPLAQLPQTRGGLVKEIQPAVKKITDRLDLDSVTGQLGDEPRVAPPVFVCIGAHADGYPMPPASSLLDGCVSYNASRAES